MKKRYDEIMEKIEVTDEMRMRILSHVQQMDLEAESRPKVTRFPSLRQYLSIAACFALFLLGTLALPGLFQGQTQPTPDSVGSAGDIITFSSAGDLSESVGFAVEDLTGLPFAVEQTVYTSHQGRLAQITYTGEGGREATYRKSAGEEDNSGVYSSFSLETEVAVDGQAVTLKGDGQLYTLATWWDGAYSYSLSLSHGLSQAEWQVLLQAADG